MASMQWSQGSNTGCPKPKSVPLSSIVCAPHPPPGNSMSRSKMLRCFQGRSRPSQPLRKFIRNAGHLQPRKPVPSSQAPGPGPGAHQQPDLQTRFWAESSSPIKRARHTLLKSQALLKTSAGNCVPLIEMKNKLGCQATVERGQEKRSSDKQLVSTSPTPDGHSKSPHEKEPNKEND